VNRYLEQGECYALDEVEVGMVAFLIKAGIGYLVLVPSVKGTPSAQSTQKIHHKINRRPASNNREVKFKFLLLQHNHF
jgi:hypothetical protein